MNNVITVDILFVVISVLEKRKQYKERKEDEEHNKFYHESSHDDRNNLNHDEARKCICRKL